MAGAMDGKVSLLARTVLTDGSRSQGDLNELLPRFESHTFSYTPRTDYL